MSGVKESVLALEGNKEGLCYSSGVITTNSNFCGFEELTISLYCLPYILSLLQPCFAMTGPVSFKDARRSMAKYYHLVEYQLEIIIRLKMQDSQFDA